MRSSQRNISALLIAILVTSCQTPSRSALSQEELRIGSGEELLVTQPANLRRGWEAVGGALSITSQRLLFQPHHFNIQKSPEEIRLADVARVVPIDYGLIYKSKNGVLVELRSGVRYKFVVNDRKKLVDMIRAQVERIR